MLKYEMDEKVVRQQVTKRGKREKKRKFSPQSLTIKIIKSSKVTEERKKGLPPQGLKYDTAKSRERKRKENEIKEKKKREREREKEREEKLFSPIVKIRKDEKRERKEFVKAWRRKGMKEK